MEPAAHVEQAVHGDRPPLVTLKLVPATQAVRLHARFVAFHE